MMTSQMQQAGAKIGASHARPACSFLNLKTSRQNVVDRLLRKAENEDSQFG